MVDALSELHDIHLPPPIHLWWPIAPGYFILLAGLIMATLFSLAYFYTKKSRVIKKAALQTLLTIETNYKQGESASTTASQINILLKQVALLFYARNEVAALEGEAWLLFLDKTSKKLNFLSLEYELLTLPYCHTVSENNLNTLLTQTRRWIKQRGHQCLS